MRWWPKSCNGACSSVLARDEIRSVMKKRPSFRCLLAAVLSLCCFVVLLFRGSTELTRVFTANFFDLQARAWLRGRWNIGAWSDGLGGASSPLGFEAFIIDGEHHLYFGPVASLLRLPILAVTDTLDGRLTQPMMTAGFVLAMVCFGWLVRRIHALRAAGGDLPARVPPLQCSALLFGFGVTMLFLASQPFVYHEAITWGVAFSLAAYAVIVDLAARPRVGAVVAAGLLATLALLSRASVGIGPVAALGCVLAGTLFRRLRGRRDGDPAPPTAGVLAALALAVALPVGAFAAVNLARFGEPFRLPIEKQSFSKVWPDRIAVLEAYGNSLFSPKLVPTTLWQYLRPDAVAFSRLPPWIVFPRQPATVIRGGILGEVLLDTRQEASSLTTSMPAAVVFSVFGLVALVRRRQLRAVRAAVAGAVVGCAGVLTIAFIGHRYLYDFVPLLALLGACGAGEVAAWYGRARWPARLALALAVVLLLAWQTVCSLALAIEYQRLIAVSDEDRAEFVAFQYRVAGPDPAVRRLPANATPPVPVPPRGEIVLRFGEDDGLCRGVLWSDGQSWHELPGAPALCELVGGSEAAGGAVPEGGAR